MRQNITIEQLNELSDEQKENMSISQKKAASKRLRDNNGRFIKATT